MSIQVMTHVWEHSQHKGSELLMLLALSDYADEHGWSYPSVGRLAKRTRLSERTVQYVLRKLVQSGEVAIEIGTGPHGCNRYHICLDVMGNPRQPRKEPPVAAFTCARCQSDAPGLHQHHIVPLSWGGSNDTSNFITLCAACHDFAHSRLAQLRQHLIRRVGPLSVAYTADKLFEVYGPDFDLWAWVQGLHPDDEPPTQGVQDHVPEWARERSVGVQGIAPNPSLDPSRDPKKGTSDFRYANDREMNPRKEERMDETSSWTKPPVRPPATARPDEVLASLDLTPEEQASLLAAAEAELMAEERNPFYVILPIKHARMVEILLRNGEIPSLPHMLEPPVSRPGKTFWSDGGVYGTA